MSATTELAASDYIAAVSHVRCPMSAVRALPRGAVKLYCTLDSKYITRGQVISAHDS